MQTKNTWFYSVGAFLVALIFGGLVGVALARDLYVERVASASSRIISLPQTSPASLPSPTIQSSPSTTPTCCMLSADIQTTCSYDSGTNVYTIIFYADIVNNCGNTINVAANF